MPYVVSYASMPMQLIIRDESFKTSESDTEDDIQEAVNIAMQSEVFKAVTMKGEAVWIRMEQIVSIQHLSQEKYEEIEKRNETMRRQNIGQNLDVMPFIPGLKGRG
jgi:hypothetical protein